MPNIPVLAVDAGATNCRAVLCNETGTVLGYAQAGSANYHSVGLESARETLTAVLAELAAQNISPRDVKQPNPRLQVQCAVFGLAGLDTEHDRQTLQKLVGEVLAAANITAQQILIDNDAMMTLLGAVGSGAGVLVISGTGSIACGITEDGRRARAGGWGHRVGDEGSGYYIGKRALTHIFRACDGRESASGIIQPILRELGVANPEELMSWVYGPDFSVDRLAALTPLLAEMAEAGDAKAISILQEAAAELAEIALTVINKLHLPDREFDLVLLGGVLRMVTQVREDVIRRVQAECPLARITSPRHEPICGGVLRGLMTLHIGERGVLERLSSELAIYTHNGGHVKFNAKKLGQI